MPFSTRTPFTNRRSRYLAGKFGMGLFLVSLGILFTATLIAFLVVRLQIGRAWPQLPPLPEILWLSTLSIIAGSVSMQWAVESIRRGQLRALNIGMLLTLALGIAFLVLQSVAWLRWLPSTLERWRESENWRFALTGFYVFTGLHALHVIGGIIPMSVVTLRALRQRYTAIERGGVEMCAMYWHFLAVVWLVLFASLMIGV